MSPDGDTPDPRPPLSAYIRTLNEERMIGAVVRAALAAAREVVVVDSGSTDKTREIAAAAGARVLEQPWLGNGGQKRAGEAAAAHDWLLDLDADEIVTDALAAEIRALFPRMPDGAFAEPDRSVFRITLVTVPPIGPAWEGFALDPRAKLYDRRRWRMPDSRAWDQLELPKDVDAGALSAALMHHSFRDFEQYMAKWNRVSTVRARETKLRPLWLLKLRMLAGPPFYFWRHYALRGLWRAGFYGFAVARGVAFGRFMRDVKQYERRRGLDAAPHPTAAPQQEAAMTGTPIESAQALSEADIVALAEKLGRPLRPARKAGKVAARQAEAEERVVTYADGEETARTAAAGDWVVTNLDPTGAPVRDRDGRLNQYVIDAESFPSRYAPDEGVTEPELPEGRVHAPRDAPLVLTLHAPEGFDILAPWGERQRGDRGYLLVNRGEVYGVQEDAFDKTYAFVDAAD